MNFVPFTERNDNSLPYPPNELKMVRVTFTFPIHQSLDRDSLDDFLCGISNKMCKYVTVEESPVSVSDLQGFSQKNPGFEISTIHGDFTPLKNLLKSYTKTTGNGKKKNKTAKV
jgi:hypothetical protein